MPRKRLVKSIADTLLHKSREAALSAVQIFNNPIMRFKSETYIVLMIIAWTYLLHAYYRKNKVEYRYYNRKVKRRRFDRTRSGEYKHWELERCLNDRQSPIDKVTATNLRFLIGLRHKIEHQMIISLDDYLSGRYQACALNYNQYIRELFGDKYGIEKYLTHSIQFLPISYEQLDRNGDVDIEGISSEVRNYITEFDNSLSKEEHNSERFSYRLIFTKKLVNNIGKADRVIEFIDPDSELAKQMNKRYTVLKETERQKFLPSEIVRQMRDQGYINFSMYYHTQLWKELEAKKSAKGFGVELAGRWFWYERWVNIVLEHCQENQNRYKENGVSQ